MSFKKGRDSHMDILNNDYLIDLIISKLPHVDVVSICLISKSWRDRWIELPYIVLDRKSRLGNDQNKCIHFANAMLFRLDSPIQFKSCSKLYY